jgi:hypothetical protein
MEPWQPDGETADVLIENDRITEIGTLLEKMVLRLKGREPVIQEKINTPQFGWKRSR